MLSFVPPSFPNHNIPITRNKRGPLEPHCMGFYQLGRGQSRPTEGMGSSYLEVILSSMDSSFGNNDISDLQDDFENLDLASSDQSTLTHLPSITSVLASLQNDLFGSEWSPLSSVTSSPKSNYLLLDSNSSSNHYITLVKETEQALSGNKRKRDDDDEGNDELERGVRQFRRLPKRIRQDRGLKPRQRISLPSFSTLVKDCNTKRQAVKRSTSFQDERSSHVPSVMDRSDTLINGIRAGYMLHERHIHDELAARIGFMAI